MDICWSQMMEYFINFLRDFICLTVMSCVCLFVYQSVCLCCAELSNNTSRNKAMTEAWSVCV